MHTYLAVKNDTTLSSTLTMISCHNINKALIVYEQQYGLQIWKKRIQVFWMIFECQICVSVFLRVSFLWLQQSIYTTTWSLKDLHVSLGVAHASVTAYHVATCQ